MNNDYEYNGTYENIPSFQERNNFTTNNMDIKPTKKRRKWPIVLLILLLLIVGVLIYFTFFTDKLDFIKPNDKYSEFDPDKGKIESNSNVEIKSNITSNKPSNTNIDVEKIDITPNTPSVVVGSKITLKTTITPSDANDKSITWKSGDTKIATVNSNGVVTGVKAGTTTITATSKNGKKASVKVTVTTKKIPVTGIKLSLDTLNLEYHTSSKLNYTISPSNATNKELIWSTSNKDVVTVSNEGYIHGENVGTAIITVKTKDGGYKDTIKINVELPEVKSISLSGNYKICHGSSTTIQAKTVPSLAKNNVISLTSSNESIATIKPSGYVTGVSPGTVTITAKTANGTKATKTIVVVRCSNDYSLVLTQTFGSYYNGCYASNLYFKGEKITDWESFEYNGYTIIRTQPICPSSYNIDKSITSAKIKFDSGYLSGVKITYE